MSEESAKAFVDKMHSDEDFAKRVSESHGENGTLRGSSVLLEEGFAFTQEEMNAVIAAEGGEGELNDDALEEVAGGAWRGSSFGGSFKTSFSNMGLIGGNGRVSYGKFSSLFDAPRGMAGAPDAVEGGYGGACGISVSGSCSGVA